MTGHLDIHLLPKKENLPVRFFTAHQVFVNVFGIEIHHPNGTTEIVNHSDYECQINPIY